MRERIIQINGPFDVLKNDRFRSEIQNLHEKKSLIDADIVFVNMMNVDTNAYSIKYDHDKNLLYRREQLIDHLKNGKNVVLFMKGSLSHLNLEDIGQESKYIKKNKEYLFPFLKNVIEYKYSGINIEPSDETGLGDDWLTLDEMELYKYLVVIPNKIIDIPLMKIRGTDKIVGGVKFYENGKIIFLPAINERVYEGPLRNQLKIATQIVNYSKCLDMILNGWTKQQDLPKWIDNIKIINEVEIDRNISLLQEEMRLLKKKMTNLIDQKRNITRKKSILAISGKNLEKIVEEIFVEIGFKVIKSEEKSRVDLIIEFEGKYIVCEVKGVNGSAKESYAAQLEKWSSEFYAERNIIPKGLLIVSTFVSTELSQREGDDFPDQMIRYVNLKNQACMTTIQLLKIYENYVDGSTKTEEVFSLLYNSVGVIKE